MAEQQDTTSYWSEHIRAWRASGLSQRAYAAQYQIHPSRIAYWTRRLAAVQEDRFTFVSLPLNPNSAGITLHGTAWRLDLPRDVSPQWLATLLGALA